MSGRTRLLARAEVYVSELGLRVRVESRVHCRRRPYLAGGMPGISSEEWLAYSHPASNATACPNLALIYSRTSRSVVSSSLRRCRTRCTSGATRAAASTCLRRASRSTRPAAAQVRVCIRLSAMLPAISYLCRFPAPAYGCIAWMTVSLAPVAWSVDKALGMSLLPAASSTGHSARACWAVAQAVLPTEVLPDDARCYRSMLALLACHAFQRAHCKASRPLHACRSE